MPTVREELQRYLDRNGFTIESYTAPTVDIPFGPFTVKLPNTSGRKAVVRQHDLHHVLTGFGTDLPGEGEIAAFELRAGCTTVAAYILNAMAMLMGLVLAPSRTVRAFRVARGMTTLYRSDIAYDESLDMSVAALRETLGIPPEGLAVTEAQLHRDAPRAAA